MLFAKAIVVESKGKLVNWATFGAHQMKQKSIVKNAKLKAQGSRQVKLVQQVLGNNYKRNQ